MKRSLLSVLRSIYLYSIAIVMAFTSSVPVEAASNTDSNAYRTRNNIIFWDPNDNGSQCGESGDGTLTGSENMEKIFNYLKSKGLNEVQAAAALGNIDQESGGDPTIIQGGKHSKDPSDAGGGGWGIIQWTPGRKVIDIAKQAGVSGPIYELATQVEILWWHMTDTSPTGAKNMLNGFKAYTSEGQLLDAVTYFHDKIEGSADTTMANRLAKAKNALRKYGTGSAPTAGTTPADATGTSSSAAGCSDGAAAGDAVKTAINYAWPEYHAGPYLRMKPAYEAATKKAQAAGKYVGGGSALGNRPGIDCGGFVTRVMQDSGVDPDYNKNKGNTVAQRAYMRSSDKYEEIKDITTATIKPGDIAVNGDHTYIYVGKVQGFKSDVASASIAIQNPNAWRAPTAGQERPADGNYDWFRIKGNPAV